MIDYIKELLLVFMTILKNNYDMDCFNYHLNDYLNIVIEHRQIVIEHRQKINIKNIFLESDINRSMES